MAESPRAPSASLTSANYDHVFWAPPGTLLQGQTLSGGWYFWDEVGGFTGPYATEKECFTTLTDYVHHLNKSLPQGGHCDPRSGCDPAGG